MSRIKVFIPLFAVFCLLLITGCKLNNDTQDEAKRRADEDQKIADYLANHGLLPQQKTESGIYKVNEIIGAGDRPKDTSILQLRVTLKTFEDKTFFVDSSFIVKVKNGVYLNGVSGSIAGLNESALLLNKGERAAFYIPSYLFFAASSGYYNNVLIEPNETIVAYIQLFAIRTAAEQMIYEDQVIKGILEAGSATYEKSSDGLYKILVTEGTGTEMPGPQTVVNVDYVGNFLDGTEFDSGTGVEFRPANVIPGFAEALMGMKNGEKATFYLPSQLAYGATGSVDASTMIQSIPAFETLRFTITVKGF